MNINQLHYFVTLAHIEHYTKAAKKLEISQPTLSHAISSLEQELGTLLFEKQGRNVELTKYGRIFLGYVEKSLDILNNGIRKTKNLTNDSGGQINIGYIFTQGSTFIPEVVHGFLESHRDKDVTFEFSSGITAEVLEKLREEKIDVAFCSKRKREKDVEFIPVSKEELVAVVPQNHPLAQKEEVELEELAVYPQICFNEGSGVRTIVDDLFDAVHVKPEIRYTVNEDGALAGLVAKGFGVGIVPEVMSVKAMNVKMMRIKNLSHSRYIYMAVMKNKYLAPVTALFVEYVKVNYEITFS